LRERERDQRKKGETSKNLGPLKGGGAVESISRGIVAQEQRKGGAGPKVGGTDNKGGGGDAFPHKPGWFLKEDRGMPSGKDRSPERKKNSSQVPIGVGLHPPVVRLHGSRKGSPSQIEGKKKLAQDTQGKGILGQAEKRGAG